MKNSRSTTFLLTVDDFVGVGYVPKLSLINYAVFI